jgi:hypothetical protein
MILVMTIAVPMFIPVVPSVVVIPIVLVMSVAVALRHGNRR